MSLEKMNFGFRMDETRASNCDTHGSFIEKSITHNDKTRWLGCPVCKKLSNDADAKRELAIQLRDRQARINKNLAAAGIPPRFENASFDDYRVDVAPVEQAKALKIARAYENKLSTVEKFDGNLVITGYIGAGKTTFACAIARMVMDKKTVLFTKAQGLFMNATSSWNGGTGVTEQELLHKLTMVDLLIIDEVGATSLNERNSNLLFDVIDNRYDYKKPTIFLSNLNREALGKLLGDRAMDRLRSNLYWIEMNWQSGRGPLR